MTRLQELQAEVEQLNSERPATIPFEANWDEALAYRDAIKAWGGKYDAAMDAICGELGIPVNQKYRRWRHNCR